MTFFTLMLALKTQGPLRFLATVSGKRIAVDGVPLAIEAEDGSGHCWNVTIRPTAGVYCGAASLTVFVRTVD